ncbi:unnamed protein product [Alternaria alternata]
MTTRQSNACPMKMKLGETTTKQIEVTSTQTSVTYTEVHREWKDKAAASNPIRETTGYLIQPIMLKTWLQGSMREDPYQAIGAVGVSHSPDGGVAEQNGDTSDAVTGRWVVGQDRDWSDAATAGSSR